MWLMDAWRRELDKDRRWVIVRTEDTGLVLGDSDSDEKDADGHLHYDLYEDKNGIRKVEISFTGLKMVPILTRDPSAPQRHAEADEFYVEKVKPWLKGIRVEGIDSYEHASQQASMDELRGDDDAGC